ncbi:MAG TPA: hypothetical protein VHA10_08715 [Hypericibacter adhaerens]|uniref:DUF4198 domain-containing protein n=1 Tax=Hypericibacter adhaerens TaxID=2602016 RepID=A0A5J6MZF5_9PROT|nr:hypothetical protein [Hypericibacter adhaerens]QEX21680.1 hypothetical protein FRZ61_16090 [Hypericibacter adhaerens]HWA43279.1 hypothetical protein [Hypericibacter adhaerens]
MRLVLAICALCGALGFAAPAFADSSTVDPTAVQLAQNSQFANLLGQSAYKDLPVETPKPADSTATLKLTAVVATGAIKNIADPISWTVVRKAEGGIPQSVIARDKSPAPTFKLPPGKYIVEGIWKAIVVQRDVDVPAGKPHTELFNYNAGTISLRMIPYSGASPITTAVKWDLYFMRKGSGANLQDNDKLFTVVAPTQQFSLPAGNYVVRASYGGTSADLVMPIEAGHSYKYTINLYSAQVTFNAAGADKTTIWQVLRAKPDGDGQRRMVASQTGASPTFLLREGKYIVRVATGDLHGEQAFDVKAAKNSTVKVKLQ